MKSPSFDDKGFDEKTYFPFKLQNCLATEWSDVRLFFENWSWLHEKHGGDEIDDYYLNGYGVEGLVKAVLFNAKFDIENEEIEFNSEGSTCYIHFKKLEMAVSAAELASSMISDTKATKKMIAVAIEEGFDDN